MKPWRRLSLGWRRALLAALLVAILALTIFARGAHEALLRILAVAQGIAGEHPGGAAVLVVAFAALSAMLAFLSSAVVVPFAVYTWGTTEAFLLLWSGWLLGGAASYGVGRFLGRPVVSWLASSSLLARYEERISRRTPFTLVLLFQLALPSEVPGYLLGLVRYAFGRYLLALGLTELPYAIGTVYLGVGVLQRRALLVLTVGAGVALLSVGAFLALHRRLARERGQAHLAMDSEGRAEPGSRGD